MCRNRLTLLLSILLTSVAFTAGAQKNPPDPNYILEYPSKVMLSTFIGEKIAGFSLMDGKNDDALRYRPNNVLTLGVGINIKGIGISLSTKLPYHDPKEGQYGKTDQLDLQLHHYKGKFAIDAYFQRYTGYHLNDNTDVTLITSNTDYPYFANMQNLTIGVNGMYVFNGTRYSLGAPFGHSDWQIRSAGSWLLGGSVFTHFISNDGESIIPPYLTHPEFMSGNQVTDINNYGATVNGGYGYNFIIDRHWFIAAQADVGAGLAFGEIKDQSGVSHKVGLALSSNGRFGIGYNSPKWFSGLYAIYHADRYDLPYDQTYLGSGDGLVRFMVARRFGTR